MVKRNVRGQGAQFSDMQLSDDDVDGKAKTYQGGVAHGAQTQVMQLMMMTCMRVW